MEYLNNIYYTEVKDKRYIILPIENIILPEREEPKFLRTQYQRTNETQMRRNQNFINFQHDELEVKPYPKKKKNIEKPTTDLECPSYKQQS